MKLPFVASLVAFAGVTSVAAAPMNWIVVSKQSVGNPSAIRIGLLMPEVHALPAGHPDISANKSIHHFKHRPRCKGMIRAKTIELSNKFRAVFGLPLIDAGAHARAPHRHHHSHHRHSHLKAEITQREPTQHGEYQIHRFHSSFVARLTHALNDLGKWEGRAVAFVIGCGLGVLIRIVYVFAILFVRSCRSKPDEEELPVEYVVFETDAPAPPFYLSAEEEKEHLKTVTA